MVKVNGSSKQNLFFYVFLLFVLIYCAKKYLESDTYNLKCIIASSDGNTYCIRDRKNINEASNLLAKATNNMNDIVAYMNKNFPQDERVKRLVKGFNPKNISETLPTSKLTAYSENKGEKLAFCLNKKKEGKQLIDINTLTFVALHELSHIMTKSIGHKQEFWENFKFLLQNAKKAGIYDPVDYNKEPTEYCGITLDDNPYYDLV